MPSAPATPARRLTVLPPRAPGASWACAAAVALALAACGGGGGGGGGGSSTTPPASVSYSIPAATLETDVLSADDVASVTGGMPTSFSVAPPLPAGLSIDASTGTISGTPTAVAAQQQYTVTASNAGGSAHATVDLTVVLNHGYDLSPKDPATFTDDDIRYFLGRTTFGATASEFTACKANGIPATVDAMLQFADTSAIEGTAAGLLVNSSDPPTLQGKFPSQQQVARYWVHLMLENPNPFQEVLAFFWHDHFASSTVALETNETYWMVDQVNLWRHSGNGNLRSLLLSMARDPMMLFFLDGVLNTKQAPNENFAREFWELFSLGVDNGYTQADIVQSARAFTGYRIRTDVTTNLDVVQFDTTRHDGGSKTLFAGTPSQVTIPGQNTTDDYQAVVDATVDHKLVAEWICRKLFEHFCYGDAPPVPVATMAAMLRANNYELTPVLKALFKSEAFFCSKSKSGIAKGPVEQLIGFCRSTGLTPIDPKSGSDPAAAPPNLLRTLESGLNTAAQRPTQPPNVNGWPVGDEWLSAQNMLDRGNVVLSCIADRNDQANANGGQDLAKALLPANATSTTTVDTLADLLYVKLTPAEHAQLVDYLDTSYNGTTASPSPFDPNNPTHVSERVRGLLYILAQHPTYAVR